MKKVIFFMLIIFLASCSSHKNCGLKTPIGIKHNTTHYAYRVNVNTGIRN